VLLFVPFYLAGGGGLFLKLSFVGPPAAAAQYQHDDANRLRQQA
jgi:hypothetical protein